jgi:hypothetical protein
MSRTDEYAYHRKIGNKHFEFKQAFNTKDKAQILANRYKKDGHGIRIIKYTNPTSYAVYILEWTGLI